MHGVGFATQSYLSDTRNSSGDEIANVNCLCDDIVHALKIQYIDSCINSATDVFCNAGLPNSVK